MRHARAKNSAIEKLAQVVELDDDDPKLGDQVRWRRQQCFVLGPFDIHLEEQVTLVVWDLRVFPVRQRHVHVVGYATDELLFEVECRVLFGGPIDGVVGKEHLHPAGGKCGLEARLVGHPRRERVVDP